MPAAHHTDAFEWRNLNRVLTPDDPDYAEWIEAEEVERWIAEGCPPLPGVKVKEADRELLLSQPLTVRQAAIRENVSERTIFRWLHSDDLKGHRAGRKWLIEPAELDARRARSTVIKPVPDKKRPKGGRRTATDSDSSSWFPA